MNNILLRTLTGSVFILLILVPLWWDLYASIAVMTLFLILGLNEYFNLFKGNKTIQLSTPLSLVGILSVYFLVLGSTLNFLPGISFALIFPLLFLLFLTELWRKTTNPLINIGVTAFSVFYLVIPFYLIIMLRQMGSHDDPIAIGMFLLIWTNDTFAYLSGRFFGKTKLFERISPKKTWEGTIGGIIFTVLIAYLISLWSEGFPTLFWIISAILISTCSIFGDLLESLFKRSLNIKDSGTILPGHGGILDRFDAALFTVPFFYCWTLFYSYL